MYMEQLVSIVHMNTESYYRIFYLGAENEIQF